MGVVWKFSIFYESAPKYDIGRNLFLRLILGVPYT